MARGAHHRPEGASSCGASASPRSTRSCRRSRRRRTPPSRRLPPSPRPAAGHWARSSRRWATTSAAARLARHQALSTDRPGGTIATSSPCSRSRAQTLPRAGTHRPAQRGPGGRDRAPGDRGPDDWGSISAGRPGALRGSALVEPPACSRATSRTAPQVDVRVPRAPTAHARTRRDVSRRRGRGAGASTTERPPAHARDRRLRAGRPRGSAVRTIELLAAGATLLVAVLTSRRRPRRAGRRAVSVATSWPRGIATALVGPTSAR